MPGQPLVRRPIDFDAIRHGAKPPCNIFGMANGPNYVWVGGEVALAELGRALAGLGPEPPGPYANANVPPAQNVFAAVQEQLGLRLDPARTPREFVVIDRVERPSAN